MRRFTFLLILFFFSACASQGSDQDLGRTLVEVSSTPSPSSITKIIAVHSPTPSPTSTPTRTHTSSPSPTPTAHPAIISGNPRGYQLLNPTPTYGAPCGLVDTFDFPLDPPNGEEATGGFGFGSYHQGYEKYHAGEDWGFRNRSNLGQSVHSIGHGQVTYAAPNGWGLDKGTVVVCEATCNGTTTFYGHLDPPSVTLQTGDCVRRGDKVGEIGNPRTPPHLHFEIRYHLPNSTGHGYWSTDPAEAGWLSPSQTIWESRLKASPGIVWTLPYVEGLTMGLGTYQEDYLFIQEGMIKAIDPLNGNITWQKVISDTIRNAVLVGPPGVNTITTQIFPGRRDIDRVYLFELGGDLTAYGLESPIEALWRADLNAYSTANLIPLPGGGFLVADRRRTIAIDSTGRTLWEEDVGSFPGSWARYKDQVIFSSDDGLWTADLDSAEAWDWPITGIVTVSGENLYIYAEDGLYSANIENDNNTLLHSFFGTNLDQGAIAPVRDGGLVVLHTNAYDRRLLLFDETGRLVWERSIKELLRGQWQLYSRDDEVYLLHIYSSYAGTTVDIYAIGLDSAAFTHILSSGSRRAFVRNTWIRSMGEGLWLLNTDGGPIGAFDLKAAYARITSP